MTRTPPSDPLIAPLVSSSRPSQSCESTEAAESHFVCAIWRIHQPPDRVEISARGKGPGRSALRGQREATELARAFLSSACLFWPLVPPSTASSLIRPRPSTSRHRDRGLIGWRERTMAASTRDRIELAEIRSHIGLPGGPGRADPAIKINRCRSR